jgi:hypothetical protein
LTAIKLPNILPEIFHIILRYESIIINEIIWFLFNKYFFLIFNFKTFNFTFKYMYGKMSFEEYYVSVIIKILITANELGLQELTPFLVIESKKDFDRTEF